MAQDKTIAKVLRKLEYGVYVVTMGKGQEGNAFTASWLTQVSSEPPMLAMAIHNKHQSARLLNEQDGFVVHLIPAGSEGFARNFYGPAERGYAKLQATPVSDAPGTGSPLLEGVSGWIDCRIVNRVPTGNHTVFIGEVVAGELKQDTQILTTSNSKLHYTG
ncbi:MAG: flavin reductase [Candidatus Zixiibacteriota bacterium]|nr:MAG: flavin reductase [candidate division Zixibacteria bacterium]